MGSMQEMTWSGLFDNEIYTDGHYWILRFMIDQGTSGAGLWEACYSGSNAHVA